MKEMWLGKKTGQKLEKAVDRNNGQKTNVLLFKISLNHTERSSYSKTTKADNLIYSHY